MKMGVEGEEPPSAHTIGDMYARSPFNFGNSSVNQEAKILSCQLAFLIAVTYSDSNIVNKELYNTYSILHDNPIPNHHHINYCSLRQKNPNKWNHVGSTIKYAIEFLQHSENTKDTYLILSGWLHALCLHIHVSSLSENESTKIEITIYDSNPTPPDANSMFHTITKKFHNFVKVYGTPKAIQNKIIEKLRKTDFDTDYNFEIKWGTIHLYMNYTGVMYETEQIETMEYHPAAAGSGDGEGYDDVDKTPITSNTSQMKSQGGGDVFDKLICGCLAMYLIYLMVKNNHNTENLRTELNTTNKETLVKSIKSFLRASMYENIHENNIYKLLLFNDLNDKVFGGGDIAENYQLNNFENLWKTTVKKDKKNVVLTVAKSMCNIL